MGKGSRYWFFRDFKRHRTFKIPKGILEVITFGNLARLTGIRHDGNPIGLLAGLDEPDAGLDQPDSRVTRKVKIRCSAQV